MLGATLGILSSRVFGFARDIVFSVYWGTSNAMGAFILAFTFPNLVRSLLGEGALSDGFVPLFNERLTKAGKEAAYRMLSNVLTIVSIVLAGLALLGCLGCLAARPWLSNDLARLTALLAAIMLPYTFFVCLVGFLTGVMNSLDRFAVPFQVPVILNLFLILGTLASPWLGVTQERQVLALAVVVLLAGVVQLALMAWLLWRTGYRYQFLAQWRSPDVRELLTLVLPAAAGAAIYQVNVLCDRLMAGWLGSYAVSSLYYSERIIYLPIGIFAVALSAACLPAMSRAVAADDHAGMVGALCYSLRHILFLTMPCVLVFMLLGREIVALAFQWGAFNEQSTKDTVAALVYYAPVVPAFSAVKILRSGFLSTKDTRTPVKIAFGCMILNAVANLVLMWPLQQRGLALATVLSSYANCIALAWLLLRRVSPRPEDLRALGASLARLAVALALAAAALLLCRHFATWHTTWRVVDRALALGVPMAAAGLAYLVAHLALRSAELRELWAVVAPRLPKRLRQRSL
jgi:putative peptidoglycan lipid II flippase